MVASHTAATASQLRLSEGAGEHVYNIPMIDRFPANVDVDRLSESLKKVLANHPVFFSLFERHDEKLSQFIRYR